MPIPFILAGAAIAAGAYGVKKGVDAKEDFELAKTINARAKKKVDAADELLEKARKQTQNKLETYGKRKVNAIDVGLKAWKAEFDSFKNVDLSKVEAADVGSVDISKTILTLNRLQVSLTECGLGGGAAVSSGAIAGFAAYGGVQALAAASTGTAISSLSGAAATNATLAWLGGGALGTSSTAFGMAGGTAVLGGVVAGPILAVGGMMLASKAEEAYEQARANERKAEAYEKQKKAASAATNRIYKAASDLDLLLVKLTRLLGGFTIELSKIAYRETDYRKLTKDEQVKLAHSALMAKLVVGVIECPLLLEDGSVSVKGKALIEDTNAVLEKINSI
ncbi:hypothetical protein MD588_08745 [Photobacterium sp. SDRW27]|uniref:hypothetical protein n=1 Tax=Photobacterium obscurum TaxID=2829490 RepID=UPI002244B745|nr:hypothetical protein [Photobacterium obscurum]MCW8328895.1 hypothetical protein [Photobacterium obscurum]